MSALDFLHGLDRVGDGHRCPGACWWLQHEGTLTFSPLAHILLTLQPKKSKATTLLLIRGWRRHDQSCHPRQEHLFLFIMCLNITGQRESDGDKLNRSSLDIVVSESPGWYHAAIALETRDVKKKHILVGKRDHVWIC